jgi:hypothetical protein
MEPINCQPLRLESSRRKRYPSVDNFAPYPRQIKGDQGFSLPNNPVKYAHRAGRALWKSPNCWRWRVGYRDWLSHPGHFSCGWPYGSSPACGRHWLRTATKSLHNENMEKHVVELLKWLFLFRLIEILRLAGAYLHFASSSSFIRETTLPLSSYLTQSGAYQSTQEAPVAPSSVPCLV